MSITDQPHGSFAETLYSKATAYFGSQPNGRFATPIFFAKALLLVTIYLVTYIKFIFFSESFGELIFCAFILGICHVFIPVNLSHDAIHGSVSANRWLNNLCRYGFEITGSNSYMYALKHLEAHQDKENGSKTRAIESQRLLLQTNRASKKVNLSFAFYLLYAQYMIFARDLVLFFGSAKPIPAKEYVKLFLFKAIYCTAFILLPFLLIKAAWWQILAALLFMYFIVTIVLVIILLMPTEKMEYARLQENNSPNEKWIIEILQHNVDFSPDSVSLNFLAGGANLNVVHYLFPSANHVHYNNLAAIIEETAAAHGILYRKQVVRDVFGIHFNYLRNIQSSSN